MHPDGESLRVSFGVLNLTHRDGHETPTPLVPGQRYRVRIQLNDAGSAFPAGPPHKAGALDHLLADGLAQPETATLTVFGGALDLPVRPRQARGRACRRCRGRRPRRPSGAR